MDKRISVLGSTGSIGVQTLEVARNCGLDIKGLAASKNIDLLEQQAREFRPEAVAVGDIVLAEVLRKRLSGTGIEVLQGPEGVTTIAGMDGVDMVLNAIVGIAGLAPTMEAVKKGTDIALANKESLVTAGSIVMREAKRNGAAVIPVDSEHAAVFQCLACGKAEEVSKIILTASGGPFRGMKKEELRGVTVEEALRHPNWSMGKKITVDSATLMNKGLEVIEARWLFGVEPDKIEVVVHPQSIIHSMVEFIDGSVIAQMSHPDMKMVIQYVLLYPERRRNNYCKLDFAENGCLTFEKPDYDAFPCLGLAFEALREGGTMPAVLNGANEAAVELFLKGLIGFEQIPALISEVMQKHLPIASPVLADIFEADRRARQQVYILAGQATGNG